jgi:hypothetical protein
MRAWIDLPSQGASGACVRGVPRGEGVGGKERRSVTMCVV